MNWQNIYSLKVTDEFGRGLYASKRIVRGDVITRCELLVLSPADTLAVNGTELQFYTFKFDDQRDCLCLGDGEIFNHSDVANVSYGLETLDGRQVMVFRALGAILPGDQLFINYAADVAVDATAYVNRNLVG